VLGWSEDGVNSSVVEVVVVPGTTRGILRVPPVAGLELLPLVLEFASDDAELPLLLLLEVPSAALLLGALLLGALLLGALLLGALLLGALLLGALLLGALLLGLPPPALPDGG